MPSMTRPNQRSRQTSAYALGAAAVLFWSTVASAFKLTLRHIDPIPLVLMAAVFSALSLVLVLVAQRRLSDIARFPRSQLPFCLLLALLNPAGYYWCLFSAYQTLPGQQALAVNYSWPVMLVVLSVIFLKQKLRLWEVVALVAAYVGVVIVAMAGYNPNAAETSLPGLALALGSTFIWAGYWLLHMTRDTDAVVTLLISFCFSIPVLVILVAVMGAWPPLSVQTLAGAAYIGFFEMGITFVLWSSALKLSSSTARVASLIFLTPFLSLMFLHLITGEVIAPATIAGLALIVGGIAMQTAMQSQ